MTSAAPRPEPRPAQPIPPAGRLRAPGRIACGVFALLAAGAVAAEPVEVTGTWHVLVHYTDAMSARPEAQRWEDRVWVIARRGSRLEWTDYPIVHLGDESGRFEHLGTNRARRIVHAWEPSPAQLALIDAGPRVNPRGVKTKTLRRGEDGGWSSGGRVRVRSATAIGYHETWSIEGPPEAPVFQRRDTLGGAGAGTASSDGLTRYETTRVSEDGVELSGRFQRDDTRRGTFRMRRTAPIRDLEQKSTPGQRLQEHFTDQSLGPGLRPAADPEEDEGGPGGE